jgi:AraC-like DNA-binding protein
MYAPIFLPPAPAPSPDVLAVDRAILEREGPFYVEGCYYANQSDASTQRRRAAERQVRESTRRAEWRDRWQLHAARFAPTTDANVSTWLTRRERQRVDAARDPRLVTVHRDDLRSVRDDLAEGRGDAAVISAALLRPVEVPGLAALVRGFPGSPVVALVSDADESQALASALLFGRAGVQSLIDCRTADGWNRLREALSAEQVPDAFMRDALATVLADIAGSTDEVTEGCARFFAAVFAPRVASSKEIAGRLGIHATTLASRFYRAGLPSPKRFVSHARLLWAAHFAELCGASHSAIAHRVGASSPQSLGRTIRTLTGMSAGQFRRALDANGVLAWFRESLVLPHRVTLRDFDPLAVSGRARTTRATTTVAPQTDAAGRAA